ncbi:HNH endonuclease family protein, partial [Nostoc sp.]|uniref:HNH endonuclease family protein n=1 Tax=Nostoc sp. TaxID=1180 RepID=UPI002FF60C11
GLFDTLLLTLPLFRCTELVQNSNRIPIYPQNAEKTFLDSNLEPLKNTLGNLTILDPAQNTYGGNDTFVQKKPIYQASSMLLNRDIAVQTNWTQQEIINHKILLIDVALKVFYP